MSDPGNTENNPVFIYLDAFSSDKEKVDSMKAHYERGGFVDIAVKKYLNEVLQNLLEPVRLRRKELAKDIDALYKIVHEGTFEARDVTAATLKKVKEAMNLNF